MITFGNTCRLPMILSLLIRGSNGLVPTNHGVGLYNGMIIDGECSNVQALNEHNLHQACGVNAFFVGIVRGYLMVPPKSRLELVHTLPDDRDLTSSVYQQTNDNGNTWCMIKNPTMNKIRRNKRNKRSWTNRGEAKMKNQRRK